MIKLPKTLKKPLKVLVRHKTQFWDFRVYHIFKGGTVRVAEYESLINCSKKKQLDLLSRPTWCISEGWSKKSYEAVRVAFLKDRTLKEIGRK